MSQDTIQTYKKSTVFLIIRNKYMDIETQSNYLKLSKKWNT